MTEPRLRALVVFESMFGNTAQVARAVADGLGQAEVDVELRDVREAPDSVPAEVDLLVVGGPTHAFSMSRASTRDDAVRQGAPADRAATGIREWLADVTLDLGRPPALAAFDTRVAKVRWLPRAAGPAAARVGRHRGLEPAAHPIGFLVDDVRGPLLAPEIERAAVWGRTLAAAAAERCAAARPD